MCSNLCPIPTLVVLSRASDPESMMADESVTTGDANKTKTVCDDSDDDESGDKWFVPNEKCGCQLIMVQLYCFYNKKENKKKNPTL
jgi:hypothetical protein